MYAGNVRGDICDVCPFGGKKPARMSHDDFYRMARSLENPNVRHRCQESPTELCRGAAKNRARMRERGYF